MTVVTRKEVLVEADTEKGLSVYKLSVRLSSCLVLETCSANNGVGR